MTISNLRAKERDASFIGNSVFLPTTGFLICGILMTTGLMTTDPIRYGTFFNTL
jgi:hypothetical protein